MEDMAPALLEKIEKDFAANLEKNTRAADLLEKIKAGKAGYADAGDYAEEVGAALAEAYQANLSAATLPDGKLYYNIAERILNPTLREDHEIVSEAALQVQQALNEAAGLGIKAQAAELNENRIQGLIEKVSEAEQYEDVAWALDAPVRNFSRSVVDDTLKANVEFQGKAGLRPRIIRRAESKCCEWCSKLAGTYDYPVSNGDVYRRHENCRCVVEYDPGSGKRQDVWTKEWTDSTADAKIGSRKFIGLKVNGTQIKGISDHANLRMQERSVTSESILDAILNPLSIGETKTDEQGRLSFRVIGEKATLYINPETGEMTTLHGTHTKTAKRLKKRGGST